jgi:hypothetical protein
MVPGVRGLGINRTPVSMNSLGKPAARRPDRGLGCDKTRRLDDFLDAAGQLLGGTGQEPRLAQTDQGAADFRLERDNGDQ